MKRSAIANALLIALLPGLICAVSLLRAAERTGGLTIGTIKGVEFERNNFVITGDVEPLPGNVYRLKNMEAAMLEDGVTNLLLNTPLCEFDENEFVVTSTNHVVARTPAEDFFVEGDGFQFRQTNQVLTILTNVYTRIDKFSVPTNRVDVGDLTGANTNRNFEIWAGSFEYRGKAGVAEYRDGVRAQNGEELSARAQTVRADLGQPAGQGVRAIDFLGGLELRSIQRDREVTITGDRGRYTRGANGGEYFQVDERGTWAMDDFRGSANTLVFQRRTNDFHFLALGAANLSFPPTRLTSGEAPEPADADTLEPARFQSDRYEFEDNELRFEGRVRGEQSGQWLTQSGRLIVRLDPDTRDLREIEATQEVRFDWLDEGGETGEARADHAFLRTTGRTNEVLTLTGDPHWRSDRLDTRADILEIRNPAADLSVAGTGHARVVLRGLQTELGDLLPGVEPAGQPTEPNGEGVPRELVITSERYEVRTNYAEFVGDVVVAQPDGALRASKLAIWFDADGRHLTRMEATGGVRLDQDIRWLTAETLTALFADDTHGLQKLVAEGGTRFSDGESGGSADVATYDLVTREVAIEGNAELDLMLQFGPSGVPRPARVRGPIIVYRLDTRELSDRSVIRDFESKTRGTGATAPPPVERPDQ